MNKQIVTNEKILNLNKAIQIYKSFILVNKAIESIKNNPSIKK